MLTYKSLLCLRIPPYAWGAWVWIAGSISTHPHFSSLAIRGSPLLLSHSAQTTRFSQMVSSGSGADRQSPGPRLPYLEGGTNKKRVVRTVRQTFRWKSEGFFLSMFLTNISQGFWPDEFGLFGLKDKEWPGAANVEEAEQRGIYYYLLHFFSHIGLSAIKIHRWHCNLLGLKWLKLWWGGSFWEQHSSSEDSVSRLQSVIFIRDLSKQRLPLLGPQETLPNSQTTNPMQMDSDIERRVHLTRPPSMWSILVVLNHVNVFTVQCVDIIAEYSVSDNSLNKVKSITPKQQDTWSWIAPACCANGSDWLVKTPNGQVPPCMTAPAITVWVGVNGWIIMHSALDSHPITRAACRM